MIHYRYMSKLYGYVGYVAFAMALIAMLSSLYISEVLHQVPCVLCWYQRICMYPLVVIIGVGIVRRTNDWPLMTLILGGIGWLIALYHSLLQWGILEEGLSPCVAGIPCVVENGVWFGFISIPFLSLIGFTIIMSMAAIAWKGAQQHDQRI